MRTRLALSLLITSLLLLAACSGGSNNNNDTASPVPTPPVETPPKLKAGAASRSILPTVNGGRDYLNDAPGWSTPGAIDADDPGTFIAEWDQGEVDVGNGRDDSAWVHDDLQTTVLALEYESQRVLLVMADAYSFFGSDITVMIDRIRTRLPADWQDAPILVSATHNHHGPDTAFSINSDWFALMVDEMSFAAEDAVAALQPARMVTATGNHAYGASDQRDPVIENTRLNVLAINASEDGSPIATLVQWTSHPESTLGWKPPAVAAGLPAACEAKGWTGGNCTAEGRYLTADYPGVLRERLASSRGGRVLYLNGPVGNQIGPGSAPTWRVDDEHPVGDGVTVPAGAQPLSTCDRSDPYLCRSFAKTESIGTELANAVTALLESPQPVEVSQLTVHVEPFFTRLTNIGFRLLIAEGDIGWQPTNLYNCHSKPFNDDSCTATGQELVDDPFLTPALGSQIARGDVLRTQLAHLDLGDVGILWMPGELPPELVYGLPADFNTAPPEKYYTEPHLHAVGADYKLPGYLMSLVDESVTLTVGLGGDQLGYYVPVDEYRMSCLDLVLPGDATCSDLAARGVIEDPQWIGGRTCKTITDDPAALTAYGDDAEAVAAVCRYGQGLGRELGEPQNHYEETNAAGWDMVDDIWAAAQRLFQ